ncbi:MAG: sulfatase-like hydrolase/transferase [Muribaculaceae bacterium]|nr:sulfatase-like hydrolase/transferase [Muribaculaceae bacterium]
MKRLKTKIAESPLAPVWAVLWNLLLVYVTYALARAIYLAENWTLLSGALDNGVGNLLNGAWMFDTSAILYTNILWIVLILFPLHFKETAVYHRVCRWIFVVINALALIVNLCDAVYFPFTLRRTTSTVFDEFSHESNLGSIFATELIHHWYLVLAAVVIIYGLWRLYLTPRLPRQRLVWWRYGLTMLAAILVIAPLCIAGMRGGFATAVRPITVSNAAQYVSRPTDAALVLNTPFSILRTIGKNVFSDPGYYQNEQELATIYTPLHQPADTSIMQKRNVVVLIVESFGREYIGALNRDLEEGKYTGYTPCIDSLISKSVTFKYSYCNGRKSIDGMPSILSSIPMFVEPFFLTPASMNHVSGIAAVLGGEGYETAFFHGAQNGSMGFQAFAQATGFKRYYGRTEFNADKRFRGDKDFDGTWAIWDEPFLQFYCAKMNEMHEPFMTAVFTASSHHPFVIPAEYESQLPAGPLEIHRCIRYTDMALGRFFEAASHQPWFKNTIFVLTSDHANMSDHAEYQTDLGDYCSPVIIYDPSGALQPEMQDKIAQQIDIMPTVMGLLGYNKPYVAFGIDVLNTEPDDTWAVNYLNGIYQYVKHGLVLQWDGSHTVALYSLDDRLMKNNLVGQRTEQAAMERELKAIIQQYMNRMMHDRLTPENP